MVFVESLLLIYPLARPTPSATRLQEIGVPETFSFSFSVFDRPVTNNTEKELSQSYNSSWRVDVSSSLGALGSGAASEAEVALAPSYPVESKSIPTIIIQERGDGLLRVEYFAQPWPNTYGLVLYNSTSPGWTTSSNVSIRFVSFGPPVAVNPQIAPRPNGNLTIMIGGMVVMADYPIAWANLSDVYLYGIRGSTFTSGSLGLTFQQLQRS